MNIEHLQQHLRAAADKLEEQHQLIRNMIPFMLADVRAGLKLGEPPANHPSDGCDDCMWYGQSLAWQILINNGLLAAWGITQWEN